VTTSSTTMTHPREKSLLPAAERRAQAGLSLIEVLVSILIFSFV